jgi:hypothetical protein
LATQILKKSFACIFYTKLIASNKDSRRATSGFFVLTSGLRPQFLGRALTALRSIGMANSPTYKVLVYQFKISIPCRNWYLCTLFALKKYFQLKKVPCGRTYFLHALRVVVVRSRSLWNV